MQVGTQEVKHSSQRQTTAIFLHPPVDKSQHFISNFKGLGMELTFITKL
jgi:hypothetical protein